MRYMSMYALVCAAWTDIRCMYVNLEMEERTNEEMALLEGTRHTSPAACWEHIASAHDDDDGRLTRLPQPPIPVSRRIIRTRTRHSARECRRVFSCYPHPATDTTTNGWQHTTHPKTAAAIPKNTATSMNAPGTDMCTMLPPSHHYFLCALSCPARLPGPLLRLSLPSPYDPLPHAFFSFPFLFFPCSCPASFCPFQFHIVSLPAIPMLSIPQIFLSNSHSRICKAFDDSTSSRFPSHAALGRISSRFPACRPSLLLSPQFTLSFAPPFPAGMAVTLIYLQFPFWSMCPMCAPCARCVPRMRMRPGYTRVSIPQ